MNLKGKPVGETHLFFGCRNEAIDYIYREELEAFAADGLLTLHTAFSRDQVQFNTLQFTACSTMFVLLTMFSDRLFSGRVTTFSNQCKASGAKINETEKLQTLS